VAEISGAVAVNGILNGAITGVKGEEMRPSIGGNEGLDWSGPLHGTGGGQHGGLARRCAGRSWRSAGAGEGERGRPAGPGGPKG
jgi:hypothetical protein